MIKAFLFLSLLTLFYLLTGGALPKSSTVRDAAIRYGLPATSAAGFVVVGSIAFQTVLAGLAWGVFGWALPGWLIRARQDRKRSRLRAITRDFVQSAASLYSAGNVTPEVIEATAGRLPDPLGRELRDMLGQYRLSREASFPAMFRNLARKYDLPELDAVGSIIAASEQAGGPAAAARGLKRLARGLRRRERLLIERRKQTYETKIAAWLAIGFLLLGLLLDATILRDIFQEPGGRMALVFGSAITVGMIAGTMRLTRTADL